MDKESLVDDDTTFKYRSQDQADILHEYETVVTALKEELMLCKAEQNNLRLEIEKLHEENKNLTKEIQKSWSDYHKEICNEPNNNEEIKENLEKRIAILQMEKDSVFQLWQMALSAIDVLEQELKSTNRGEDSKQFSQEQVNNIKETYSEAIKILELKLTGAKEHFLQQQAAEKNNREKIDDLNKEKTVMIQKLKEMQDKIAEKEKIYEENAHLLKENFNSVKIELEEIKQSKKVLLDKLNSVQNFAASMISQDKEAKSKISEAVDLVETAVKEKEMIAKEKLKLESYLANISKEYAVKLEKDTCKIKQSYNKNIKKYLAEIRGLKRELRDKVTLLDRSQREYKILEDELEKLRQDSQNYMEKAILKMNKFQKIVQERSENGSNFKDLYDDKVLYLERQVVVLEEKLSITMEKLKRSQIENSRYVEDHVRENDDHTKELMQKCSNLEKRLSRALSEKETIAFNLSALQDSFEREIQKRDNEKKTLDSKLLDIQNNFRKCDDSSNILHSSAHNCSHGRPPYTDMTENIISLQQRYEKKIKELAHHVEVHQQMSNKWKEEANLLTEKFQKRTNELRTKINSLQLQNDEITRELLVYQKLIIRCHEHTPDDAEKKR